MIDLDNVSDEYLRGVQDCALYVSGMLQATSKEFRAGRAVDLVGDIATTAGAELEARFIEKFDLKQEEYRKDEAATVESWMEEAREARKPRLETTVTLPRTSSDEEKAVIDQELKAFNSKIDQLLAAPGDKR